VKPDVFKAIADPTRRQIVELLLNNKGISINAIAAHFNTTRQATTKHLYYLKNAGLISIETVGRERLCYPAFSSLIEVNDWLHILKPLLEPPQEKSEIYTWRLDERLQ
jgi:DNA-binding transcriptional ArsR family regulator